MNSSTSHSKPLFAVLVGSLIVSYIVGAVYTVWINPEIRFWRAAYRVKVQHARDLDSTNAPKTVFAGGSSCAFQIDPKILEEQFGIPSVNMGLHAGMGARAILALTLPLLKPGDHLVLNVEPSLLTGDLALPPLGLQMLAATGNFNAPTLSNSFQLEQIIQILLSLRPGLRNAVTMTAKVIAGRPSYRYQISDIHYGGFLTTNEKGASAVTAPKEQKLSTEAREYLSRIRKQTHQKYVSGQYLLSWSCIRKDSELAARKNLEGFAREVGTFFPPINDGKNGVHSNPEDFADTSLHLTRDGATRRTECLGQALQMQPRTQTR